MPMSTSSLLRSGIIVSSRHHHQRAASGMTSSSSATSSNSNNLNSERHRDKVATSATTKFDMDDTMSSRDLKNRPNRLHLHNGKYEKVFFPFFVFVSKKMYRMFLIFILGWMKRNALELIFYWNCKSWSLV